MAQLWTQKLQKLSSTCRDSGHKVSTSGISASGIGTFETFDRKKPTGWPSWFIDGFIPKRFANLSGQSRQKRLSCIQPCRRAMQQNP